MLATRVGAGIAAEIGSMKVTEQIDALRMSGVLPIDYLIVPRFIASLVMTLMLATLGGAVMYAAGGLTAQYSFGVNPNLFFDFSLLRLAPPRPDGRQGARRTARRSRSSPGSAACARAAAPRASAGRPPPR